jgi:zinc transport system substrate-binding protein
VSIPTPDRRRRATLALATLGAVLALTACSGGEGEEPGRGDDRLVVLVSSYPLEHVVTAVAGTHAQVQNLTARGADSHATELSPEQVASLGEADLVVHLSGMQTGVDQALAMQAPEHVLDAVSLADLEGDPHFWLDPTRMATLGQDVADELAELDPDGAADYRAAADQLAAELGALDAEYRTTLSPCRGATLVTAHEAFAYLADAYGLEQVGITGIDPHVEPSPARMRQVIDVVQGRDGQTVFFEATTSPEVAQSLADDLGITTSVLHPIERVDDGQTYDGLMADNLAALRAGLTCTAG